MPQVTEEKLLCIDNLRHAEYYGMTEIFDDLYARSAKGEVFTNLMDIITSKENILLAYRNIKANKGSDTPGTDGITIKDIGKLTPDEVVENVRYFLCGSKHGYRPRAIRRKEIPKEGDPTKTRPLGIPCMWDRLIQQCIKQVLEPICEAKFSKNSYGFRPGRSTENAIAAMTGRLYWGHLSYSIEFDIEGFFDNVNDSKMMRQIWAMGIHDKVLIDKLWRILKAPILMPDGSVIVPVKGTPQGGILSPLLANIVLNELDHWVESQWEMSPILDKYNLRVCKNGSVDKSKAYKAMRKTGLKEMYIVRYADDFRIFCRNKDDAEKIKIAVTQWLSERLKLNVSQEKTRIVNVKQKYSLFLGYKFKLQKKGKKWIVISHVADKALARKKQKLVNQAKNIAKPRPGKNRVQETKLYNSMVLGMQNYYCKATRISEDFNGIGYAVNRILHNRLKKQKASGISDSGRKLTTLESNRYGKSKQLKYLAGSGEPIYPIGYVRFKKPWMYDQKKNIYTKEGREKIHSDLKINTRLMHEMARESMWRRSVEFADNRISKFSAQRGRCAITGREFQTTSEVHCHHIIPRSKGGSDKYDNLVVLHEDVHKLIHAKRTMSIYRYMLICGLTEKQIKKVNEYREKAGLPEITMRVAKPKVKKGRLNRK